MFIKSRTESNELQVYKLLDKRKVLSIDDAVHYARLEKGYQGELSFDERVGGISKDWLVLNDLQLESNSTHFQIDSTIISQKSILLLDIKNHEGDYYIEDGRWYSINGKEIYNPVPRLERSEFLLRRLLQDHGYTIPIQAYLVYVNPDFHLYNTTRNLPIIFPTQLNRFFHKLHNIPSNINEHHKNLAHKLTSLHKEESPFTKLPKYHYEELRKGVMCAVCDSFSIEDKRIAIVCKKCGHIENVDSAIIRSAMEYTLLFPQRKITTNDLYDWCKGLKTKRTIRMIISKHFQHIGHAKSSYYVIRNA
ncbi:NERD domain-containing protein [Bacillus sp. FJAT-49732]|uniref:NERD domain-containing protein n=1 Tax=Lederbergia citrisecunda TaxID=2833583 RepID=A0A942TPS8_9BACI|nr:nuclease-related domain-containing protein [Lederbergia citrisecunda]MBS4201490.1 NERD domain-containing protein [Lederbergia citrisecunda]